MIEEQKRWYHYLMLPYAGLIGIFAVGLILTGLQVMAYDILEEDIVTFSGQCEVVIGPKLADGVVFKGAKMTCGDEYVSMSRFEAPFLYTVLTHNREPVIICTKTVSEYLKSVNWSCDMDPEEVKEQND